MTIVITLPEGPPKSKVLDLAFSKLGMSGFAFNIPPDQISEALDHLNAMMAEWAADMPGLNYQQPNYGSGDPSDASGLQQADIMCVAGYLAQLIAPRYGKTMAPEAMGALARSRQAMLARYASLPTVSLPRGTVMGQGNWRWNRPVISGATVIDSGDYEVTT